MKQKWLLVFCVVFALAGFVTAQSRPVTNANLEKYQQERLKADREYRENYARLGMPSPEELERRRERSRIETERLAADIRAENIELARLEVAREANARLASDRLANQRIAQSYYGGSRYDPDWYYPNFIGSYSGIRHFPRHGFPVYRPHSQPGYFAGGQFWPTGSRTTNRPIWHVGPRR